MVSGTIIDDPARARLANGRVPLLRTPLEAPATLAGAPFASAEDAARATSCLAVAMYYEAATEGAADRRAVAQVVLNRVPSPLYPHTVCGVVYQRSATTCQFTFACDGAMLPLPPVRHG